MIEKQLYSEIKVTQPVYKEFYNYFFSRLAKAFLFTSSLFVILSLLIPNETFDAYKFGYIGLVLIGIYYLLLIRCEFVVFNTFKKVSSKIKEENFKYTTTLDNDKINVKFNTSEKTFKYSDINSVVETKNFFLIDVTSMFIPFAKKDFKDNKVFFDEFIYDRVPEDKLIKFSTAKAGRIFCFINIFILIFYCFGLLYK